MSTPVASDHANPIVEVENLNMFYGETQALHDIDLSIPEREVTAFIGPSGCGKSTLLRCLNRLNDLVESARIEGSVRVSGLDIYAPDCDVIDLRRRVGMVFQKSNPFPKSIYENVAYGLRVAGENRRWVLDEAVEKSLKAAALWDEVKDRIKDNALSLSGGQQQRLCIARTLAVEPEVVLMDEPCSALDPIATARVEETITDLKSDYTIIVVTHNLQQAARISTYTAFYYLWLLDRVQPDRGHVHQSPQQTDRGLRNRPLRLREEGAMERRFDQQLDELKQDILKMSGAVEESIEQAVRALVDRDDELVQVVLEGGKKIDDWEIGIEEACLKVFATQGPMASDLRLLACILKINEDLERINDEAVNIVQRAEVLNKLPLLKPLIDIPRMSELAQSMVKDALDAFVRRDVDLARDVGQRDEELDLLRDQIFRELLTYMHAPSDWARHHRPRYLLDLGVAAPRKDRRSRLQHRRERGVPRRGAHRAAPKRRMVGGKGLMNDKILVVEDEPDILALVSYHLEQSGFAVVPAEDEEQALSAIEQNLICLVVLDLMLPGIGGLEVCRLLKQNPRTKDIPVLMLTARAGEVDRIVGLELGADDYLCQTLFPARARLAPSAPSCAAFKVATKRKPCRSWLAPWPLIRWDVRYNSTATPSN